MESTMFTKFCMAQRLHALVSAHEFPSQLASFIGVFQTAFQPNARSRGTLLVDALAFSQTPATIPPIAESQTSRLQPIIRRLLQKKFPSTSPVSPNALIHTAFIKCGLHYKPYATSPGHGCVAFRNIDSPFGWAAGRIDSIFTHSNQTFIGVKQFQELSEADTRHDNYRRFSNVAGRLFYDTMEETPVLVLAEDIIAHLVVAHLVADTISQPHFLGLPQDRD